MKRVIEKTDDGSATLFVPDLKKQKEADVTYIIQDLNPTRWNGRWWSNWDI